MKYDAASIAHLHSQDDQRPQDLGCSWRMGPLQAWMGIVSEPTVIRVIHTWTSVRIIWAIEKYSAGMYQGGGGQGGGRNTFNRNTKVQLYLGGMRVVSSSS